MIENLKSKLIEWLEYNLNINNKKGYIVGISGGVDSCVLTHLLHLSGIPYHSVHYLFDENEVFYSNPVISFLKSSTNLKISIESLQESFATCYNQMCKDEIGTFDNYLFRTILKAKLAHIDLGYRATKMNFLVLGTINLDEFLLGYFVKNTCIGDLLPFANIPKMIIRKLGAFLGIPEQITKIKASGCVYNTYAEEEWGITEEEVYYLVSNQHALVSDRCIKKFHSFVNSSEHKRNFSPIFIHHE